VKICRRVVLPDVRVRLRVPFLVVHSVEDPIEILLPRTDDPLEAAPILGSFDLAGVSPAYGSDGVGKEYSPFEQVEIAEELEVTGSKIALVKVQQVPQREWEASLMGQIMNRQHIPGRL
jgi:hypothetical protein